MAAGDNSRNRTSVIVFTEHITHKSLLKTHKSLLKAKARSQRQAATSRGRHTFDEWLSVSVANIYSVVPEEQERRSNLRRRRICLCILDDLRTREHANDA
jgi:hypothetical protein